MLGSKVLFRNSYQSGVFSIFFAIGRHPLYLWMLGVSVWKRFSEPFRAIHGHFHPKPIEK